MKTPSSEFLQAATPSMREVATQSGEDYEYLRKISSGRAPSREMGDRIARWGWRHVRELVDKLAVLSPDVFREQVHDALAAASALPDEAPQPEPTPIPSEKGPEKPTRAGGSGIRAVSKESQTRRGKTGR